MSWSEEENAKPPGFKEMFPSSLRLSKAEQVVFSVPTGKECLWGKQAQNQINNKPRRFGAVGYSRNARDLNGQCFLE